MGNKKGHLLKTRKWDSRMSNAQRQRSDQTLQRICLSFRHGNWTTLQLVIVAISVIRVIIIIFLDQLTFTHQVAAGVFLFGSGLSLRQHTDVVNQPPLLTLAVNKKIASYAPKSHRCNFSDKPTPVNSSQDLWTVGGCRSKAKGWEGGRGKRGEMGR